MVLVGCEPTIHTIPAFASVCSPRCRRWFAEQGQAGFVKMFDPTPFNFEMGEDEDAVCERCLKMMGAGLQNYKCRSESFSDHGE